MRDELENPDFKQISDDIAGAVFEKGGTKFALLGKRARGENKPDIAEGQNFLHYVIIRLKRSDES